MENARLIFVLAILMLGVHGCGEREEGLPYLAILEDPKAALLYYADLADMDLDGAIVFPEERKPMSLLIEKEPLKTGDEVSLGFCGRYGPIFHGGEDDEVLVACYYYGCGTVEFRPALLTKDEGVIVPYLEDGWHYHTSKGEIIFARRLAAWSLDGSVNRATVYIDASDNRELADKAFESVLPLVGSRDYKLMMKLRKRLDGLPDEEAE